MTYFVWSGRKTLTQLIFSALIAELANRSFLKVLFLSVSDMPQLWLSSNLRLTDMHAFSSYWYISNMDFVVKNLERLFLARIQPYISSSLNFNQY